MVHLRYGALLSDGHGSEAVMRRRALLFDLVKLAEPTSACIAEWRRAMGSVEFELVLGDQSMPSYTCRTQKADIKLFRNQGRFNRDYDEGTT